FFKDKNKEFFIFEDIIQLGQIVEKLEKSKAFAETDGRLKKLLVRWFDGYSNAIRKLRESKPVHDLLDIGFDTIQQELKENGDVEETLEKIKYFFKQKFEKEISAIENLEGRERKLSADIQETQAEETNAVEDSESLEKVLTKEVKDLTAELRQSSKLDPK